MDLALQLLLVAVLVLPICAVGETSKYSVPGKKESQIIDAKSCDCPNSKLLWYLSHQHVFEDVEVDLNLRVGNIDIQNGDSLSSYVFSSGGTLICSTCQNDFCSKFVFLNVAHAMGSQWNASDSNNTCNALTVYDSQKSDFDNVCYVRKIVKVTPSVKRYVQDVNVILSTSENGKCSSLRIFIPSFAESYTSNFTDRLIVNQTTHLAAKENVSLSVHKTMTMFYENPCLRIHNTTRTVDIIYSNISEKVHDRERLTEVLFETVAPKFQPFVMRRCEFWNFTENSWSAAGCEIKKQPQSGLLSCRCPDSSHDEGPVTKARYRVSERTTDKLHYYQSLVIYVPHIDFYLELVGYLVSLYGLVAIGLTGMLFPAWRNELTNKILMHMSAALGLNLLVCMVSDVIYRNEVDDNVCVVHGFLKQYSFLVRWCWMLVMGVLQLRRIVTVSGTKNTPNLLMKIAIFVWGAPLLLLSVLLLWDQEEHCCCPNKTIAFWTITFPAGAIMIANLCMFVVIVCRIVSCCGWGKMDALKRHGVSDTKVAWRSLRTLVLLLFIFEVPWIFGFIYELTSYQTVSLVVFQYFLVTSHGFTMFIFFVAASARARTYWKNYSLVFYCIICISFMCMITIMLSSMAFYFYHYV